MAENTIDIAGASQDLQTIEDFVNLPADSEVYPRLLPSVNVGTLSGIRDAIFEAGGLPATPKPTKASMEGSDLVDGDYAYVTDDTVNNGLYVKTAGAWVKSDYDPALQAKNYVDANPLFLPVRLTASDNLDNFLTPGEFYKATSSDIDVAVNNYPAKLAGVLRVSGTGNALVQYYTVFSNNDIYIRRKITTGFAAWVRLATDVSVSAMLGKYPSTLEWQTVPGANVSYSNETRTVIISGYILAPLSGGTRRVRINNVSVVLPTSYSICYLDLVALGTNKDINELNASQYLKVADYNAGDPAPYVPEVGKVPLFKYDAVTGKAVACAGFVPIYSTESAITTDVLSPCYYQFSGNSLKVYSQVKANLYVGFNVLYQFYDDDIIYEKYWRIANAEFYTLTDGMMVATGKKALETGESEFVIKQSEAKKDFTGGYHGDEQFTDVLFLANGLPVAITGTVPLTACGNFEYIIKSTMHETTETTGGFIAGHPVIADHIKHTSFLNGGYKTYNKIIFNYTGAVQTVYHGISCISKDVVNKVMIDKDFTLVDLTGSGSEIFREVGNYRKYIGFNTANNLSAQASARIINDDSSDVLSRLWVSDRNTDSKYYRRSPVDLPVSIGDVFESEFECYFNSK